MDQCSWNDLLKLQFTQVVVNFSIFTQCDMLIKLEHELTKVSVLCCKILC